jgi:hypothetical protein
VQFSEICSIFAAWKKSLPFPVSDVVEVLVLELEDVLVEAPFELRLENVSLERSDFVLSDPSAFGNHPVSFTLCPTCLDNSLLMLLEPV